MSAILLHAHNIVKGTVELFYAGWSVIYQFNTELKYAPSNDISIQYLWVWFNIGGCPNFCQWLIRLSLMLFLMLTAIGGYCSRKL